MLHDLKIAAMIPMNGNVNTGTLCGSKEHWCKDVDISVLPAAGAEGKNDGRVGFFHGGHNTLKHFNVPDVEMRNGIMTGKRFIQHIFHGCEHKKLPPVIRRHG